MLSLEHTLDEQTARAEDDSPFLSMADFFSLISLTVIYVVIAFSPQSPLAHDSVDVVTGISTAVGPASEIENEAAYVALLPEEPGLLLRVVPAGNAAPKDEIFQIDEESQTRAIEWLQATLMQGPEPARVIFYMGATNERGEAHKLLNNLIRVTKRDFPVSLVFLEEDSPAL